MHMVDCDSSNDDSKEVYATKFVWSSNDKPSTCASLKPIPNMKLISLLMFLSVIGSLMS